MIVLWILSLCCTARKADDRIEDFRNAADIDVRNHLPAEERCRLELRVTAMNYNRAVTDLVENDAVSSNDCAVKADALETAAFNFTIAQLFAFCECEERT